MEVIQLSLIAYSRLRPWRTSKAMSPVACATARRKPAKDETMTDRRFLELNSGVYARARPTTAAAAVAFPTDAKSNY